MRHATIRGCLNSEGSGIASARHLRFRAMLSDPNFHIFYHAPVLILISGTAESLWKAEDCALAAENLMLAAYVAGLGSCWIGFAQRFLNSPDGKKPWTCRRTNRRSRQSLLDIRRPGHREFRATPRRSAGLAERPP